MLIRRRIPKDILPKTSIRDSLHQPAYVNCIPVGGNGDRAPPG